MGLLLLSDYVSQGDSPSRSIPLWLLLAAAMGLTYWECRARHYHNKNTLWWVTFVALTHVVGYMILRFFVRPRREA